jgi:hypothetical protein
MADLRHRWSGHREIQLDRAPATYGPVGPPPPAVDPIDEYILDALSEHAPAPAGRRTVPVLHADHGRWWSVVLAAVGHDIALRIERPRGDRRLIHQCLVSQGDRRWSHQAGTPQALARAVDATAYSVRFPDDFEGSQARDVPTGSFQVAWSALYGGDNWALLNTTTISTVYRGTLTYY